MRKEKQKSWLMRVPLQPRCIIAHDAQMRHSARALLIPAHAQIREKNQDPVTRERVVLSSKIFIVYIGNAGKIDFCFSEPRQEDCHRERSSLYTIYLS